LNFPDFRNQSGCFCYVHCFLSIKAFAEAPRKRKTALPEQLPNSDHRTQLSGGARRSATHAGRAENLQNTEEETRRPKPGMAAQKNAPDWTQSNRARDNRQIFPIVYPV
jgi:hypothetical protein